MGIGAGSSGSLEKRTEAPHAAMPTLQLPHSAPLCDLRSPRGQRGDGRGLCAVPEPPRVPDASC